MRRLIDLIIVLGLVCVLGGMIYQQRYRLADDEQLDSLSDVLLAIRNRAVYHGSLGEVPTTPGGMPLHFDAAWFDVPPRHPLITQPTPWIADADQSERSLIHPRRLDAADDTSQFWYNPHRGVVRARVPKQHTEQATRDLYYRINQVDAPH